MATLARGRPWWRPACSTTTSRCTCRRCWRSCAAPTCSLPPAWGRSPSTTTSPRPRSAPSPGPPPCGGRRAPPARPARRPHASSPRRRCRTRAWWSEPSRTPSKTWWGTCRAAKDQRSFWESINLSGSFLVFLLFGLKNEVLAPVL